MTVKQFIKLHPKAQLELFTPGGYVVLTPEQCQRLLKGETVSASNGFAGPENVRRVRPDELLPQTIFDVGDPTEEDIWNFLTGYPEESSLPENADPLQRLRARLDDCLRAYKAEQLMSSPSEVFMYADEIAATMQVYKTLKDGCCSPSDLDFLLNEDNALAILRDEWCSYNDVDHSEELGQVLFQLRQELEQEEEQDQGPTMESPC